MIASVLKAMCRSVAVCGVISLAAVQAEAVTLDYHFAMNNNGFSANFISANTSQTRYFHGPGTVDVSYDTVTLEMTLIATSIGKFYGADSNNNADFGNVLVSNVTATANIHFTNIIPGINAGGLLGELPAATGNGTFTFSDIGLGNGLTSIDMHSMPMSGADFASLPAAQSDFFDLLGLGNGIYWQYMVTSALSSFFGKNVSFSWYDSDQDVNIAGINFGHVHTDLLASEVPEPATGLLLGSMLLGALARRRKA